MKGFHTQRLENRDNAAHETRTTRSKVGPIRDLLNWAPLPRLWAEGCPGGGMTLYPGDRRKRFDVQF